MLQCSGQSYGSSVSQTIVSEAVVEYNQASTLELVCINKFHVFVVMAMTTPNQQRAVYNHRTGLLEWTTGLTFFALKIIFMPSNKICLPCILHYISFPT